MAILANTFLSTAATMNREELSGIVSRLDPEDTPIYSTISKGTAATTHPEWGTDSLNAPGNNVVTEGDEYAFDVTAAPVRYGNYTQILRKTAILSGSQDAADEAGDVDKVKETKLKRAIELRKDVEFSIVTANPSLGGNTRQSGSLSTWITTNASRGATGANGGFNAGTKLTVAPTNGTQRALTRVFIDDVLQSAYQQGANIKHMYFSAYAKRAFVTILSDPSIISFRKDVTGDGGDLTAVNNIEAYRGPHGTVMVHMDRVMGTAATARNAFMLDPGMVDWLWFRKIQTKDVAVTGDADKIVILGEGCLKVKNEKGIGVIADIFGLTATT
jgi:hypothetical protein